MAFTLLLIMAVCLAVAIFIGWIVAKFAEVEPYAADIKWFARWFAVVAFAGFVLEAVF